MSSNDVLQMSAVQSCSLVLAKGSPKQHGKILLEADIAGKYHMSADTEINHPHLSTNALLFWHHMGEGEGSVAAPLWGGRASSHGAAV